jgi:hypothetical protein
MSAPLGALFILVFPLELCPPQPTRAAATLNASAIITHLFIEFETSSCDNFRVFFNYAPILPH